MKENELLITRTYPNMEGQLKIGFKKVETEKCWWADYYFVWKGEVDGPYADEGEAFGGWYRQHQV